MDLQSKINQGNVDAYGVRIPHTADGPLHEITWAMDRDEGGDVNKMKSTHLKPYPEPLVDVPDDMKNSIMVSSVDYLLNWARKSSMFPLQFGLACCAFEMIATAMARTIFRGLEWKL